jgi:hypothetical protein
MGNFAKRSIAITATVGALTATGVAFAAWTSTGSGSASATASTAATLTVVQTGSVTGLYPSGNVTAAIKVTNTNPYQITLSSLKATGLSVDATHATAGCTPAASTVTIADLTGLTDVLAAGANVTKNMTVSMGAGSADACQGATFTFTATATGASS